MTMELFDLPNVRRKEDYKDKKEKVPTKIAEVVTKCAMNNPLWQFTAIKYSEYNDGFYGFEVRASNGEILGTIERTWARNETAIAIENDRIKAKRVRGNCYTTKDVDKALLQIKKTFAPMNVLEHMGKAKKEADNVLDRLVDRERYDARNYNRDIESEATKWVLGNGFSTFLKHVQDDSPSRYKGMMEAVQKRKEHLEKADAVKTVWDGLSNGESVLLIKEGSNYMVQHKGKVSVFDDEHLPEDWKTNLGMLKLVENGTVIEDRGCRVAEATFVIKVEEKDGNDKNGN